MGRVTIDKDQCILLIRTDQNKSIQIKIFKIGIPIRAAQRMMLRVLVIMINIIQRRINMLRRLKRVKMLSGNKWKRGMVRKSDIRKSIIIMKIKSIMRGNMRKSRLRKFKNLIQMRKCTALNQMMKDLDKAKIQKMNNQ